MTCVLSERNIAPARPQWGKYSVFQRAGAKNISRHPTTPHAGAVFFTPAPPLPHRREKTHPARLHHRPGGTKFTQHAQNAPKRAISSEQGEFCTAHAVRRGLLGEFFRETWRCAQVLLAVRRRSCRSRWGFCTIRSWLTACRRRVVLLLVQPPRLEVVRPRLSAV